MKNVLGFTVLVILSVSLITNVYSSENMGVQPRKSISSVTRLNLLDNIITGERAEYSFSVLPAWAGYLIADREKQADDTKEVEKLIFYYVPRDRISKPVYLLSIYVFLSNSSPETSARTILQTDRYVFAVDSANTNPFFNETDKGLFNMFLAHVADDALMESMLHIPSNQTIIRSNTVYVSGLPTKGKVIMDEKNVTFLPIRDTCSALGYAVDWLANSNTVTISKSDSVALIPMRKNERFSTLLFNNKSYVSLLFFIETLGCNVEVDERNNVFLYP